MGLGVGLFYGENIDEFVVSILHILKILVKEELLYPILTGAYPKQLILIEPLPLRQQIQYPHSDPTPDPTTRSRTPARPLPEPLLSLAQLPDPARLRYHHELPAIPRLEVNGPGFVIEGRGGGLHVFGGAVIVELGAGDIRGGLAAVQVVLIGRDRVALVDQGGHGLQA